MPVRTFSHSSRTNILVTEFPQKLTSQVSKNVDDFFCFFTIYFVYYPRCIQQLVFNCKFSVPSRVKIYLLFTLRKRCRYASNLFVKNIQYNFFILFKKGAGTLYRRVPLQKKPCQLICLLLCCKRIIINFNHLMEHSRRLCYPRLGFRLIELVIMSDLVQILYRIPLEVQFNVRAI